MASPAQLARIQQLQERQFQLQQRMSNLTRSQNPNAVNIYNRLALQLNKVNKELKNQQDHMQRINQITAPQRTLNTIRSLAVQATAASAAIGSIATSTQRHWSPANAIRLERAFGDLKATVGRNLEPSFLSFTRFIEGAADTVGGMSPVTRRLTNDLVKLSLPIFAVSGGLALMSTVGGAALRGLNAMHAGAPLTLAGVMPSVGTLAAGAAGFGVGSFANMRTERDSLGGSAAGIGTGLLAMGVGKGLLGKGAGALTGAVASRAFGSTIGSAMAGKAASVIPGIGQALAVISLVDDIMMKGKGKEFLGKVTGITAAWNWAFGGQRVKDQDFPVHTLDSVLDPGRRVREMAAYGSNRNPISNPADEPSLGASLAQSFQSLVSVIGFGNSQLVGMNRAIAGNNTR